RERLPLRRPGHAVAAAGRPGRPHRLRRGGGGGSAAQAFGEARSPAGASRRAGNQPRPRAAAGAGDRPAPPGPPHPFVLPPDGRQNAGNALAVAQAARDAGADVYYVPAPLTFKQEVVVESMVLPVEARSEE